MPRYRVRIWNWLLMPNHVKTAIRLFIEEKSKVSELVYQYQGYNIVIYERVV